MCCVCVFFLGGGAYAQAFEVNNYLSYMKINKWIQNFNFLNLCKLIGVDKFAYRPVHTSRFFLFFF